jgi:hypothetical protein
MRELMSDMKYVCLSIALSLGVAGPACAKLKAISDAQMSNITGQGYMSIDQYQNPDASQNVSYTRINYGLDIETQMNADKAVLGQYARAGETRSADVNIDNLSLGHIYDSSYYANNPSMPKPVKADGSSYHDGEIVPFKITDPFIEFAKDDTTGSILGMRVGFGGAEGILSGSIQSLTGNVNVQITDHGSGLKNASSTTGNFFDKTVLLLAPLLTASSPISAHAELVRGTKDASGKFTTGSGEIDRIRSGYVGMPNGSKFTINNVNGLTTTALKTLGFTLSSDVTVNASCFLTFCGSGSVDITPKDCYMMGVATCFPLTNFQSLPVGKIQKDSNGNRTLNGQAAGMFLSFESKDVQWLKDVKKSNPTAADFITATKGAFFNIPNGVLEVDLNQALKGIPRVRTEYIDRGKGLF